MPAAEPTLLDVMKQLELAVRSRLEDIVRPAGLTARQYTALTVLERRHDLTCSQLARRSCVTSQAMAQMVAALEGQGLILRLRDTADRRRLVIALTAEGNVLLRRYRSPVAALQHEMLRGLTADQADEVRRSLIICGSNLTARHAT